MEKKNKKRNKISKKIIAASLLAVVLIVNFVYSSFESVEAKGIFASVETKAKEAAEGNAIKILEVLPDGESMGMLGMLMKGKEPFEDIIADYTDEEIYEFAKILNKYGMINMDSTTSAIYPLTYYKPGEKDKFTSNVPDLTEEQVGYGLSEQNLVAGYFKEVSASELETEKVYYQEIIVTATPTPEPTEEPTETPTPSVTEAATPIPTEAVVTVTPEPTKQAEVTAEPTPTQSAAVTEAPTPTVAVVTAEPTQEPVSTPTTAPEVTAVNTVAPTATTAPETVTLHKNVRNSVVVAQADVNKDAQMDEEMSEGQMDEPVVNDDNVPTETPQATATAAPTATSGVTPTQEPTPQLTATPTPVQQEVPLSDVYFTDENGEIVYLNYSEEGLNNSTKEGRFFRFVAAEEGVSAPENSYQGTGYQFVFVSRAEIRNNNLFMRFVLGITDEAQLQNEQMIELTTVSVEALEGISNLTDYDLVYLAQPIFYNPTGTKQILEWAYANPDISAEDKAEQFSPWAMLASTQNDSYDTAAKKILTDAISATDPLKLVVETSILEEYERAIAFYTDLTEKLEGMDAAAISEESLEALQSNGIYKALLLLAQDDFGNAVRSICNEEDGTYVLDDDMWESDGLVETLVEIIHDSDSMYQLRKGHYVNKNIYFYKHNQGDYDKALCTTEILSVLNGDFRSTFKKSILSTQFPDVVSAIDHENETNAYFESEREQMAADEISTDVVFQYLLNYTGVAVEIKKNHISVLEIEPCADFSYDYKRDESTGDYVMDSEGNKQMTDAQKTFIDKWIHYFAQNNRYKDVSFTCMSMQEFIGKNEDLNATYDLIYIGSNIGKFQTTDGVRRFNDTDMTGLVYSHVGDLVAKQGGLSEGFGLLDRDYSDGSYRTAFNSNLLTDMRTTGNDLTTYKKQDLLNFLSSGYPVIVAENLLTYGTDKVPKAINAAGQGAATEIPDTSDTRTVYIRKPKSNFYDYWDNIWVHYWNSAGAVGDGQATYVSDYSNGDYYTYKISIPKSYDQYQVYGKNGANTEVGRTPNQQFQSSKDILTVTVTKGSSSAVVTETVGYPGGTSGNKYTVDNSSYLYQILKIATAQYGSVDVERVKRNTLNYDAVLSGIAFDWEDRTFPNLLTEGMDEADAHTTSPQYLNETKVFLNLTNQPQTYKYETDTLTGEPVDDETVDYLKANSDGRYYLTYEFSISTLAGTLSEQTYDCQLFVDANFDGKFSENSEQLDSIVIKEAATGTIVTKEEGDSVYHLKENTAYTLSRKLPKSFDGCINWKIQVTQNNNRNILASETGYCAIPVTPKKQNGAIDKDSDKQKINILQITSGTSTAEDKEKRIEWSGTHVNMEDTLKGKVASDPWYNLLANIPDFKLNIKTVSAKEFADACVAYDAAHSDDGGYAVNLLTADNENYDMLVIGFIDVFSVYGHGQFSAKAEAAMAEAINTFGNTGKSILFTHDTTAWNGDYQKKGTEAQYGEDINSPYNTSYLTVAIRDLCGNDQYGLMTRNVESVGTSNPNAYISQFFQNASGSTKASATGKSYTTSDTSAWSELIGLGKDMAFKPNSNQEAVVGETQGSTYINLRNRNYDFDNGGQADTYVQYFKNMIPSARKNSDMFDANTKTAEEYEIGKINDGAITEYPYDLPDTFDVSSTHSQYWTVDIESDNNADDESDLVVWYCINERSKTGGTGAPTDDFYKGSPNDVRNNYYIYNKGNITYSGAGHSPISNENEIKLFINTMIAAYNAKIKVPEISIVESGEPEAPEVENIILPYDTTVTEASSEFVNFGTGTSGTDGKMKIYFNVYDGNLTARDKNIKIDSIFITDSTSTTEYTDDSGNVLKGNLYTNSTQLKIYDATNNQEAGYEKLVSGRTYYIYANIGEIFKTDQSIQLHMRMHTDIGSDANNIQKTDMASDFVTISRAEIFDLD